MTTIPTPLLRLYAQTFRRYRLAGYTVPQALAAARADVIDGRPAQ
jgi:hypothetical protein